MFLKLTSTFEKSNKTYPVLVNSENIEYLEPVDEGEEGYEFGVRCSIINVNSRVDVTQTIYEIADMIGSRYCELERLQHVKTN